MNASDPHQPMNALPLAPPQHQVWLDQQSYPDSAHLNIGGTSTVVGPLDIALMEQALGIIVQSSTAMRLQPTEDGRQMVVDSWPGKLIDHRDLSRVSDHNQELKQLIRDEMSKPFAFDGSRPWRIYIWRLDDNTHSLWIRFHHLVMDGFGTALFFKQWSGVYNALTDQTDLPELHGLSYQQYITQANDYLDSESYHKDAEFWRTALPQIPPSLLQKQANINDDGILAAGYHHYSQISRQQYNRLNRFAKDNQVTTYHLFIAALVIYLCRTCAKQELVLGIPILNRKGKKFKSTLGMFSAIVPLKVSLEPGMPLGQLLKNIATGLRGVFRHAQYPLYHLVRDLNLLDTGRDSMFDVLLSFEPHSYNVNFSQAQLCEPKQLFASTARYPLMVNVCEFHEDEPVELVLESSLDYFTPSTTEQLSNRLHHLLGAMIEDSNADIDYLPLMGKEERYELIYGKHADVPSHAAPKPFIGTFEHLAALHPKAVALSWLNGEMDYGTFNQQANRLAHKLLQLGAKSGDIITVVASRLPQTIISFFAISKIGAAFLPVDPQTSPERLSKILSHSNAPVVLSDSENRLKATSTLDISGQNSPLTDTSLPDSNPAIEIHPDALAVVLFTSGSTGEPKGVMMGHSGLSRRMAWLARTLNFGPGSVALQSIQLTFDPSLNEILLPLTHGGSLALPPPEKLAPTEIAHYCEHFGADYISSVPTILRYISQTAPNHPNLKLKAVGCGGERLTRALALEFARNTGAHVYNFWGPTETTIFASAYLFDPDNSQDPVAIGEPIDDTAIYILDDNLEPLPTGTTGQIYVGGKALALGYLNEPELTAEKFLDNPFEPGNKLYKTGDLGYWDNKGQLQFVNRMDNMIKLRGQRIEPTQVEAALCSLSFVQGAAVKLHQQQLHGWIEPVNFFDDEHLEVLQNSLKEGLLQILPGYMVPSAFTQVKTLPRQPGGKLDYNGLIADPIANKYVAHINGDLYQPKTPLQQVLLKLLRDTLNNQNLHIESDFFTSGGNSLDALNLLNEVQQQLGHRLPLATMLKSPTVKGLSKAIMQRHQPLKVTLSTTQQGVPLYLAASGHGDAIRLKPLAKALEGKYQLHMLQPPLEEDHGSFETIEALADQYASLIELQQHQSPPLIAGFSIGGISALETTRKLIARGIPIGGLVLIDSSYPSWLLRRTGAWHFFAFMVDRLGLQELSLNQRTLGSLFNDQGLNGQINALGNYQPQALAFEVTLIVSTGLKRWHSRLLRPWRKLLGEFLTEHQLPGFHGNLFSEEHVGELAKVIEGAYRGKAV